MDDGRRKVDSLSLEWFSFFAIGFLVRICFSEKGGDLESFCSQPISSTFVMRPGLAGLECSLRSRTGS